MTEDAIRAARADLKMNPEVRVSLLNQLGTVLQARGKTDEARALLAANYADGAQRLGERHSATIAAGNALARAEMVSGDFPASRAMFDLMLSRSSAERPSVRAAILSGSGVLASKMRDPEVALRDAERGYALCQRDCREEDRIELGSEFADVLTTFGKPAEAMAIYKELDVIVRSRYGERHIRRATLLGAMSSTARLLADASAAAQYAREALVIDDAVLQPTDYRRSLHLYNLALALVPQREYKEATAALEQSLSIEQLALGASHPDVSYTLNAIGFVAIGMSDFAKAVRYLADAEKISTQKLGDRQIGIGSRGLRVVTTGLPQ